MMNVLAISLVLSSIAAAGVFYSSTEKQNHPSRDDVLVKEEHLVIVVDQYEREVRRDANLSPSPPPLEPEPSISNGVHDNAKEKIKQASSVQPDFPQFHPDDQTSTPGDLISDALGKSKENIAETLGKAKERVSEKAHEIEERKKEVVDTAADATKKVAEDLKSKVKTAHEEAASDNRTLQGKAIRFFEEGLSNFSKIIWREWEVGYGAAKYATSREVLVPLMGVVHLLGIATAYGIGVWVTFVSTHVLVGVLPKQQFGVVQSKIYPVYFKIMVGSIGCALLAHMVSQRPGIRECHAPTFQVYNMLTSVGLVLFNLLYLEPRATKVMFEKMKLEKEEGMRARAEEVVEPPVGATEIGGPSTIEATRIGTANPNPGIVREEEEKMRYRMWELNERLKKLNALSSFLNVLTLMSLAWHLVYLGHRLHTSA